MMNKRILVLFLAIFGLSGASSFGMNPAGPMRQFPSSAGIQHQSLRPWKPSKDDVKKLSTDLDMDYGTLKKMSSAELYPLFLKAQELEVEKVKNSSYSKFQLVRFATVALASAWRIHDYATRVCAVFGRNDLEGSNALKLGSFMAGGILGLLDIYGPGKVGGFVLGAACLDILNNIILARPSLPAFTSPRIG